MKISHNWLQKYFTKPLPSPEKLDELFTFHVCEVESIDKSFASHDESSGESGKMKDTVYDLKVLPDRAHYALCHKGIANEIYALTDLPRAEKEPIDIKETVEKKPTITIDAKDFCRRYIGRFVEVPKIGEAPLRIRDDLNAIGQRAINSIVDATNYVMFDIGQPLHAFDADKVKGGIAVRAAKKGEKIELLDSSEGPGKTIELLETDHVIADDEGPLAIAGVKGGKRAAISLGTRRLILESANFDPTAVRKTSTKYDLRSESSRRYENEISPELAIEGMNELCSLILESDSNAKFGPIVDNYPTKATQTVIEIDPKYINDRLGVAVPEKTAKNILEKLGLAVEARNDVWKVTIPYERLDLKIAEDLIEEVGRIYGYEHVKGILPPKSADEIRVLPIYYLSEKIKNILAAYGYSEVSLYSLVETGDIETAKPLAKDKAFARKDLSYGMISCVEKNALHADLIGLEAITVFEIGNVFSTEKESVRLTIGAAQVKKLKGVNGKKLITDVMEVLKKELAINIEYSIIEKGTVAVCEIDLNDLVNKYKLSANASYEDLNFKSVSANSYKKFSQYPFIVRDIAVFVGESVDAEEVWSVIEVAIRTAKSAELLVRHALFDTFKKDAKVSYAFRMVFQSMDRTLTDEEANMIMTGINDSLKKNGWTVR